MLTYRSDHRPGSEVDGKGKVEGWRESGAFLQQAVCVQCRVSIVWPRGEADATIPPTPWHARFRPSEREP
jgi:hypothetical protein